MSSYVKDGFWGVHGGGKMSGICFSGEGEERRSNKMGKTQTTFGAGHEHMRIILRSTPVCAWISS